jgi:putative transcriptional regulator
MLRSIYATCVGRKPKTDPTERVFNRIVEARERAGISRQQLADLVDVHYQTAGYLERGEYSPSLVLALRIADALSTSVESLFSLSSFPATSSTNGDLDENNVEEEVG